MGFYKCKCGLRVSIQQYTDAAARQERARHGFCKLTSTGKHEFDYHFANGHPSVRRRRG